MTRRLNGVGGTSGGKRSSLQRGVSRLALLGLGVQLLVAVLVLASAVRVGVDGLHAVATRDAEVSAANVLAGMADQQTGLLTYMEPAQPDSLLLYTNGQKETERSLKSLRAATAGTPNARQEELLEAAVGGWQSWAEELRARSVAAVVPVTDPAAISVGRRLFRVFATDQAELVSRLEAESAAAARGTGLWTAIAVSIAIGGSMAVAAMLALFALRVVRHVLKPLGQLARASERVAQEGHAAIPYVGDQDEVGELARALQGWQDVSAVRTILVEQAPVGICQIDAEGHLLTTNEAFETMLGYSSAELVGRAFWTFLDPADVERSRERHEGLMHGGISHYEMENRWLRKEGSVIWFSMVAASVLGVDRRPQTVVGIMEDITERKQQAERAAWIQRELLPKEQPELEGYELAAACLPAQDVGGDFYDWVGPEEDGQLDITVADVMGKGAGSALIMATLRTALRTAPHELGPAARVSLVAESMSRGLTDDGLFVTLFHARLDTRSGLLRYVDGGHGYCVVRRVNGELERLAERSLPLGVRNMERFKEGEVELAPGDLLLAYTDGLVEVGERTIDLGELTAELESAAGAGEMVERLVATVRGEQGDDVIVMVLRRDDAPVPNQKLTD